MADISAIFGKPASEVVQYLKRKRQLPSDGWETVSAFEHQRSFTVAQTAGFNVLGDIHNALQRAKAEGWSHKQFQEHLEPLLRAKGWWGKAIDKETGEIMKTYPGTNKPVQYGSPARLRLIYDTHMASSYGAGRFERQLASKDSHPYLRYVAVMDKRTRATHKALHGQVWPVDHPFWQSHYPPNGFRCRCMAQSLSRSAVANSGVSVNAGGMAISRLARVNAAGDVMPQQGWRTEDGREFWTDPGFGVAPGNAPEHLARLADSIERLPEQAWTAASSALAKGEAFAAWRLNPQGDFPIAQIRQADLNKIAPEIEGKTRSRVVYLSAESMQKQVREHPELRDAEYDFVQQTLLKGKVIQDDPQNLIFVYEEGGQVAVVKATKTGEKLFLTSVRRLHTDQVARDMEISRLMKKGQTP